MTSLGQKRRGEGAAIPSPAAIASAVEDALQPFGVKVCDLPLTPEAVWRLANHNPETERRDFLSMIPGAFEYYAPRSLGDAVKFLSEHKDDVKILSGGQSSLPLMKMRLSKPAFVVGHRPHCRSRQNHRKKAIAFILGALVTHAEIENSALLKSKCPPLPQTATTIADVQVRNRGTLGGSIAHADPAGDWPATVTWRSTRKSKSPGRTASAGVKCDEFFSAC